MFCNNLLATQPDAGAILDVDLPTVTFQSIEDTDVEIWLQCGQHTWLIGVPFVQATMIQSWSFFVKTRFSVCTKGYYYTPSPRTT